MVKPFGEARFGSSDRLQSISCPDDPLSRASTLQSIFHLLALTSVIVILGAAPATSQVEVLMTGGEEEEEAEVNEDDFEGVEKMLVEVRRRSQDIQKIGESVSSFSANDILDRGLTNFNDLQYSVPSLFSGGGLTKITLRGVGSEIVGPGVDPGFAVHVNNVFSSRETTGLINYFDIERVDVMRGPQGTLWGRNSTGGALNIITKRAEHEFDAGGDAEYNWYDSDADGFLIRGMLNVPLVEDKLALRVALLTSMDDGHMQVRGENHSQRVGDTGASTLRASLRWVPHEDVTVDLIGSWLRSNNNGGASKFDGDYFTTAPGRIHAGAGPGHDFTGASPNPSDPYKGRQDEPTRSDATVWTATMLVAWRAEDFKFDSIFGYQSTDFFTHLDQDYSDLAISVLDLTDKSRQISQEFLINSTWDRPYNYTFGTIYQYDWTPRAQIEIWNPQAEDVAVDFLLFPALPLTIAPPDGFTLVDTCPIPIASFATLPASCPPTKAVGAPYADFTDALAKIQNHVVGIYGNLSWIFFDDLTINAGGRFSYTYRDWNDDTIAQTYAQLLFTTGLQILQIGVDQSQNWKAGTWKVSAEYQVTEDHLFWASAGTGSRAGGFNFSEEDSFDEERVLAVEAGIKNTFFDDRLTLNVTGFWYDWEDPQIAATENALPVTENAPSAISYGVELEWFALPVTNLALNGSFGWLEAFYNRQYFSGDNTIQIFTNPIDMRVTQIDLEGNRIPRSPRFTASFGAQYAFDYGSMGSFTPRVDFYYRDEVTFRQFGNSKDVESSYTRTDARITWRSETEKFWFEVYGRNLENEAVKTNQQIVASVYRTHTIDAPLNAGIRLGYDY